MDPIIPHGDISSLDTVALLGLFATYSASAREGERWERDQGKEKLIETQREMDRRGWPDRCR